MQIKPRGWIGVDFDGTLAVHDTGEPIPAMVERVKRWVAEGQEVRIVTARVNQPVLKGQNPIQRQYVERWCRRYLGVTLKVTASKDPYMIELWDDRAVHVVRDTGAFEGRSRIEPPSP